MANVVRLISGGTIQVRTGVLAGVGPQGPRGQIGPQGPDGPQGPQGEPGPQGQILQVMARANVSVSQAILPATPTLVSFGTVAYDDMSCFTSATNITLNEAGDYLISAWVTFGVGGNPADGARTISIVSTTNGVLASQTLPAVNADQALSIAFPHRVTQAGEIINIRVTSTDDVQVSVTGGSVALNRVGSGPRGLPGPQGEPGPTGATGDPGPAGPPGNANSGFATYGDLV